MQQSNAYIIGFVVVLCVVVGGLLAGASYFLAPAQKKSVELETKSQILSAVSSYVEVKKGDNVLDLYKNRIRSTVVNYKGEEVTTDAKGNAIVAEQVDVAKNYKEAPEDRLYPVFRVVEAGSESNYQAYVIPVYGNGLWDRIWGYVALDDKLETIVGVSYDHKAETPGLGQRIATQEIQDRYIGKSIYDGSGKLVGVTMTKGEHGGGQASIDYYREDANLVDGMSGATLTAQGVNQMLKSYLQAYRNYFKKALAADKTTATAE